MDTRTINRGTDDYHSVPFARLLQDGSIVRASLEQCDLQFDAVAKPAEDGPYTGEILKLRVPARLQSRRLYFAFLMDDVKDYSLNGVVELMLSKSVVCSFPIIRKPVANVGNEIYLNNAQTAELPYMFSRVKTSGLAGAVFGDEANTLAAIAPNSLRYRFIYYRPDLLGSHDQYNYWFCLLPYELNLYFDELRFFVNNMAVTLDNTVNYTGLFFAALGCHSQNL